MIVDDDDVTRGLLRSLLRTIGLEVLGEAGNGARAMAVIQKHRPQIVCLDIDMPGLSGLDVLAQIRASGRDVVVLMITAMTTEANVRAAMEAKADGVIAKPFSTARVAQEIERALARSRANKPT